MCVCVCGDKLYVSYWVTASGCIEILCVYARCEGSAGIYIKFSDEKVGWIRRLCCTLNFMPVFDHTGVSFGCVAVPVVTMQAIWYDSIIKSGAV